MFFNRDIDKIWIKRNGGILFSPRRNPNIIMNKFQKTPAQLQALKLLQSRARHVLLFGGSRSGKTFILTYALLARALKAPGSRHAILRFHGNGARYAVGCDTLPKVVKLAFPGLRVEYLKSDNCFILPNRSEIWLGGLDADERADKILGREFATVYFNECSEIPYSSVTTALTRLAQRTALVNRAYYDCNPAGRSHWSYRLFIEKTDPESRRKLAQPDHYASFIMNPADNLANLPPGYLEETLENLGDRQRRRFLEGRWFDDSGNGLWRQSDIDRARVEAPPAELCRIVIGVDPAVTANPDSDWTGIVAAALGADGEYYILEDASVQASPLGWASRAVECFRRFDADRIVGEVNQGGDLIVMALRNVAPEIPFKAVRATRGKWVRAEPAAALYEQGKVHHAGHFRELEDEMCNYRPGASSPDRMDALVWALTELAARRTEKRAIFA